MNKKYFFSHRVLAMLLTLTLCLGMIPTASAAQQNSYHDPVEHQLSRFLVNRRDDEADLSDMVHIFFRSGLFSHGVLLSQMQNTMRFPRCPLGKANRPALGALACGL